MRFALAVLANTLLLTMPSVAQVPAEVEACRLSGLAALKERSPSLEHLTFDMRVVGHLEGDHAGRGYADPDGGHG